MKKAFKLFIIFVVSLVIVNPTIVKADLLQLDCEAYSKYVSVGSEFIYAIKVEKNNFNGTVTFDNNVLEVIKVETAYSGGPNDTWSGSQGTITHTVNDNKVTINHTAGDYEQDILVKFKVKSYPSDGTTTVKVKANNNLWFGEPSDTMTVIKGQECPSCPKCEKDETNCPVCEECETNDESSINVSKDEKTDSTDNGDKILLYTSLGACGVLAIAVVILAFRKK